jgi:hypothetical protein
VMSRNFFLSLLVSPKRSRSSCRPLRPARILFFDIRRSTSRTTWCWSSSLTNQTASSMEIVGVKLEGKAMQVLCRYGEPGPIVQKVISHGAYCAVVVNRFAGDVVFIRNSD